MTKKLTNDEFVERFNNKYGKDNYKIIGTYVKSSQPVEMIHIACGSTMFPRPNDLFSYEYFCNSCRKSELSGRLTKEEFDKKLRQASNNNLYLVSDYLGHDKKVEVHCVTHNLSYVVSALSVLRKDRTTCPGCKRDKARRAQAKDLSTVNEQLLKKHKGRIVLVGEYVNTHTKADFECQVCKNVFSSEPNSVLRISGCPFCSQYTGEVLISDFLTREGINFESQVTFDGLVDKRSLSYDFYLPDFNLLIEYNGEQHYRPIEFFGGEDYFKVQVYHDELKSAYAKDNGYRLLSIRYTNNNESIIETVRNSLA